MFVFFFFASRCYPSRCRRFPAGLSSIACRNATKTNPDQERQQRPVASTEPSPRDDAARAPGGAAGSTPRLLSHHTTDATGTAAAAPSPSQGGNPSSAHVPRTRSAEALVPPRGPPASDQDVVTRHFGFRGGDGVSGDGGTGANGDGSSEPPEGCRLA